MLLTKESDYAIRIIRALKLGNKLTVKNICEEEEIPEPFTYKILKKLEKAGIVQSVRGARGGYFLCRSVEDLTLADVILSIDTPIAISQCTTELCTCSRHESIAPCTVHKELSRIQNLLMEELQAKTLAEIFGV